MGNGETATAVLGREVKLSKSESVGDVLFRGAVRRNGLGWNDEVHES